MTNSTLPQPTPTTSRPLAGRIAVVTGATSGIGAATARRLSADGAAVVLVGRRADRLDALREELAAAAGAAPVLSAPADVGDPAAIARVAEIAGTLGRPDLVVLNAGTMMGAPFEQADTAEWDRMVDVNLNGVLAGARAFIDGLLDHADAGRPADLVIVSSVAAHLRFAGWGVYGATKAAVTALARNLRIEFGPRGVRVRAVEPGLVATELGLDARPEAQEIVEGMRAGMGALDPADLAAAIAFTVGAPAHMNVAELVVVPTRQG